MMVLPKVGDRKKVKQSLLYRENILCEAFRNKLGDFGFWVNLEYYAILYPLFLTGILTKLL